MQSKDSPFQVAIAALLFAVPAGAMLLHRGPAMVAHYGRMRSGASDGIEIEPEHIVHGYGYALALMSLSLFGFYLALRRKIRKDEQGGWRRKRDAPLAWKD